MDNLLINEHKLIFHPGRVAKWLDDVNSVHPIYMEVSPSGACNHRCKFCALDYLEYKPNYLDVKDYCDFIKQTSLKSIMFGGEGEPLMHKEFAKFVEATYVAGIDCALTTNGVLLTPQRADFIKMMKWIKISVDAGTADTYHKVHGTSIRDWQTLWRNIENLVKVKGKCKVGLQFLLLEYNEYELEDFVMLAKDSGVDYAVIKEYSQHHKSNNKQRIFIPEVWEDLKLREIDNFKVIIRSDNSVRGYDKCLALPFWRYLQANGDLWACSAHLGDERFRIGHIAWGKHNLDVRFGMHIENMIRTFNIGQCRLNCRMTNCNEYLHRLKYPEAHDNFI